MEEDRLQCSEINLLAERIQDPKKGVEVKDRKGTLGMKTYPRCFIGSELVDWIYSHVIGLKNRQEAADMAQKLMSQGLFRPVSASRQGKAFRDAYEFYRFSFEWEAGACEEGEEPADMFGDKTQVSSDKLDDLLPQFRDPEKGVECKNRKYHLKTYSNCFIGSEAVDWMVENLNVSRATAIELGQKMINMNFFVHVVEKDKPFLDEFLFYRFVPPNAEGPTITPDTTLYDFSTLDLQMQPVDLSIYKGKVLIVTNVASF